MCFDAVAMHCIRIQHWLAMCLGYQLLTHIACSVCKSGPSLHYVVCTQWRHTCFKLQTCEHTTNAVSYMFVHVCSLIGRFLYVAHVHFICCCCKICTLSNPMRFSVCRTNNQLHVCSCMCNARLQSAHWFYANLLGIPMASTSYLMFECLSCSGAMLTSQA